MNKLVNWIVVFFVLMTMSAVSVAAVECGSTPTDGCVVTQDTTFVSGTYNLPNGISIQADNVELDCNGALINGSRDRGGSALSFSDLTNITIENCRIENYFPANPKVESVFAVVGDRINGLVLRNNIVNNTQRALFINGTPADVAVTVNVLIENNSFIATNGSNDVRLNNSVIRGNLWRETRGFLHEFFEPGAQFYGDNLTIEENHIEGGLLVGRHPWDGIPASNFRFEGNTFFMGSVTITDYAKDMHFSGNTFDGAFVEDSGINNIWCDFDKGNDYVNGASYSGPDPNEGTCPPLDSDNDGVLDDEDLCPDTILPESIPTRELNPNHYADVDGDTVFETTEPKSKDKTIVDSAYTLVDTYGCSCEQILSTYEDEMKGHWKHGCSNSVMEEFIAQKDWIASSPSILTGSAVQEVKDVKPDAEEEAIDGNPLFSSSNAQGAVMHEDEPSSELMEQFMSPEESSSTTVKYEDSWYVNQGSSTEGVVWGGYNLEVYADDVHAQADCICFDWCDDGSDDNNNWRDWDNCYCESNGKVDDCKAYSSWVNKICTQGGGCSVTSNLEYHHDIGTGSSGDKWKCGVDIREYRDCDNSAGQRAIYNWAGQDGRAYWVVYGHQYDCDTSPGPSTDPDYEGDFDALWVNIKSNTGMCSWSEECDENHDAIVSYNSWATPSDPCRTKNWYDCSYDDQCVSDKCEQGECSTCSNNQCTSAYWNTCTNNDELCCDGDEVFGQWHCDYYETWSECTSANHVGCQQQGDYYCTVKDGDWRWRECPLGCSGDSCFEKCGELYDGQILYNSVTLDPTCTYDLPNGIHIWADDVILNCDGAVIQGDNLVNGFAVQAFGSKNIVIKNCKFKDYDPDVPAGPPDYGAAIWFSAMDHLTIKNNEFENVMIAINLNWTGSDNVLIEGNTIHDARENAIFGRLRDSTIKGNTINAVSEGNAIYLEGARNVLEDNTFWDSVVIGFGTEDTTLRNNTIEDFIYNAGQGTILLGNTFLDSNVWDDGTGTVYCEGGVGNEWRASPNVTLYNSLSTINSLTLDPSCAWDLPFGILLRGEGTTLDCQGATLVGIIGEWDGETTWGTNGIDIWTDDIVIKNCIIEGYATGITTWRTKGHLIENNNITVPVIPNTECPDEKIVGECPVWGFPRAFAAYGSAVNDSVFRNNIFNNSYEKSFHLDGSRNVIEDNIFIGHFNCYEGGENSFLDNQFLVGTGEPSAFFYGSGFRKDCGNNVFRDNVVDTRDVQKDWELIAFTSSGNTVVGNTFMNVTVWDSIDGVNIWCEGHKGNLYLDGASYNGPDLNEGTCEPVGDLEVLEVLPIQVIRDVPLIQGKSGLIRTVVNWTSATEPNIEAKLTYSLVPTDGSPTIQLGDQWVHVTTAEENISLFEFKPEVEVKEYNVTVEATTFHSESDYTNNINGTVAEIIDTKPLEVVYVPVGYIPGYLDSFEVAVDEHHEFLTRTYPLADDEVLMDEASALFPVDSIHLIPIVGPVRLMQDVYLHAIADKFTLPQRVVGIYPEPYELVWEGGQHSWLSLTPSVIASARLGPTTAHELGHSYGLCDEYRATYWNQQNNRRFLQGGCPNGDYDQDGELDSECLDTGCHLTTLSELAPWSLPGYEFPPFNNFMGAAEAGAPDWVDQPSYLHLITQFSSPTRRIVEDRILISGFILRNENGLSVEFDPFLEIGPGEILEDYLPPGNLSLELLDSRETILASLNFTASFVVSSPDEGEVETNMSGFVFVIERPPTITSVRFKEIDAVIEEQHESEHAPTVRIISPSGETAYKEEVVIEWEASDEDGDPLTYAVGISSDGGESWNTLVVDYPNTSITFDIAETLLDPSAAFQVRVRATDGFLTSEAITDVSFELNPECVDTDGDDVCDDTDNCVNDPNPLQLNFEEDELGDVCDPDDDNDGVVDEDDWCQFSALPELAPSELNPNHYADIDGDGYFESVRPKHKSIIEDVTPFSETYGCSCKEILDVKPGQDKGELKHGCTKDTMNIWIKQKDWAK